MIKSKNPVYWLLKIKNPTHQIDENLGLNPGWVFWFSSLLTTQKYILDIFAHVFVPLRFQVLKRNGYLKLDVFSKYHSWPYNPIFEYYLLPISSLNVYVLHFHEKRGACVTSDKCCR